MRWRWYSNRGERDPFTGVSRSMSTDVLIERLLRRQNESGAGPKVMPGGLAHEIKRSLEEHAKSSTSSVIGKIGTAFEAGDEAEINVEIGGLSFRIQISAFALAPNCSGPDEEDDFNFDDDDFEVDEPEEVAR